MEFQTNFKQVYELASKRNIDLRVQQTVHHEHEMSEDELRALAVRQINRWDPLHLEVTFTAEGLQLWQANAADTISKEDIAAALRALQASMMAVEVLDLHSEAVETRRRAQRVLAEAHPNQAPPKPPDVWLGKDYKGILPFFQLNILLGGLFYPGFKPEIFFERTPTSDELKEMNTQLVIKPPILIEPDASGDKRPHYEHMVSIEYALDDLWCSLDPAMEPEQALLPTLDRFLTVTGDLTLLPIKWRVERARRALLAVMLGVVHRKQHLTQLREKPLFPENFDYANEPQLRGYVTLLGAKLPLLSNISSYLDPILKHHRSKGSGALPQFLALERLAAEWGLLLGAISSNIDGLNSAIVTAWQERVLYEQEQTRAEQEAMAEIERARVSSSAKATTIDSLFGAMVLVFTIAAFSGDGTHNATFERDLSFIALGLIAVSLLWITYRVRLSRRRRRGADQRHHYELNLRLDRHTTSAHIDKLLSLNSSHPKRRDSPLSVQRRGSYRVERISDDEAMHKVHILSLVHLSPRGWRRLIGRTLKVPLSAIYEVLFHMPTLNGELLLREVRLTCYSDEVLTQAELRTLSEAAALDLIDPFVDEAEGRFSDLVKDGADPSSALFKTRTERVDHQLADVSAAHSARRA